MAAPLSETRRRRFSLANIAIFEGLLAETLEKIQGHCVWREYASRELIIDHLDTSDEVFFMITGHAFVTIRSAEGKEVSYRELGPKDIFGEYAAIDGRPRSANVEARSSCIVAALPAAAFRGLLESEPQFSALLLRHFVREIRELTTRVYEFSTLAVRHRVQSELLRLARMSLCRGNSVEIVPAPTHAELASRTSTHREAVTRELNRLAKIGILRQRQRSLTICDITRLAHLVDDALGE